MASTRGRQVVIPMTNKSGGSVAAGDVVIIDTGNDAAFTTTTSARSEVSLGVAQETIANNAVGRVLVEGYAALINVPASVTRGHYIETHTVAKQATGNSTRRSGSFGQFLTGGTTPTAWLWGSTDPTGAAAAPTDAEYVTTAANGSLSAEKVVTAPASGGNIAYIVRKSADEIVNNSAVLQDDNHLLYALAANEEVEFDCNLFYDSGTTPDIKFAFTVPASATIAWSFTGADTSLTGYSDGGAVVASGTAQAFGGNGAGTVRHCRLRGIVANSTNAGNLQLQWAQNTQNVSDTTVRKNSTLKVWKLA